MTRYKLFTRKGIEIIGMAEMVPCTALTVCFDIKGEPEYAGQSVMDWDNQQSRFANQIHYVCADGRYWLFDELIAVSESEEEAPNP